MSMHILEGWRLVRTSSLFSGRQCKILIPYCIPPRVDNALFTLDTTHYPLI